MIDHYFKICTISTEFNSAFLSTNFAHHDRGEGVFLLRVRPHIQTQTCGRGRSEARAAVRHTFDVLHVYKHFNEEGIVKYPYLSRAASCNCP